MRRVKFLAALLLYTFLTTVLGSACAIEPKYEDIQANETAFLVKLDTTRTGTGQNDAPTADQVKFGSEEYLNANKVPTKRVTIAKERVWYGNLPWQNNLLDTVRLIKVDRTPASRNWTKATTTGTSPTDQAIKVESKESIDFYLGVNASASIREENAAKFLYNYNGIPLAQVMDTQIREYVQKLLFNEFGILPLAEGQAGKKEIFGFVERETRAHFEPLGITIDFIGGSEGLTYVDPKIQEAINRNFQAQQEAIIALAEQNAATTRNATEAAKVKAAAQAEQDAQLIKNATGLANQQNAEAVAKSQADAAAYTTRTQEEAKNVALERRAKIIQDNPALVQMQLAENNKGNVPDTLIINSGAADGSGISTPIILPIAPARNNTNGAR